MKDVEAAREREIIRFWNRLRLLEREGRSVTAVLRQIAQALRMRAQVHRQRHEICQLRSRDFDNRAEAL